MKQDITNKERGLIQLIVIIILAIIILSLLGVSIKSLIDKLPANNTLGDNFTYVWNSVTEFFNQYVSQYYLMFRDWIIGLIKNIF